MKIKNLLLIILSSILFLNIAHSEEHYHHPHHGAVTVTRGGWWGLEPVLAGVIIGGIVTYELNGRRVEIYDNPPPGYERVKVCPAPYFDYQLNAYVTEPCHIEWIPITPRQ